MIKLFKTVQRRRMTAFALEPKKQATNELKKIAREKKAPRFLTRKIIFKLKKKQSIKNSLASPSVTFVFYRKKSKNKGKNKVTEKGASSLAFTPGAEHQSNKANKNCNRLKEHKLMSNYIINTRPIKILQTRGRFRSMFYSAFLKIKPFLNLLQKFTSLLLKKNISLVKGTYPFLYGGLKGASTISGFKKVLYNKILVQDRRLKPAYNRRKHNSSHYMVVQNQLARLDKTFIYLGKHKLANMVGFALKTTYPRIFPLANTTKHNSFNNRPSIRAKAIPKLVSIIEGQVTLLLWRNQFNSSLTRSRQDHRQGVLQGLNVVCKKNSVILLKK